MAMSLPARTRAHRWSQFIFKVHKSRATIKSRSAAGESNEHSCFMTPERWEQIERLYHSALECEADEREPFLDRACPGDSELRREIASLLAHDGLGDSFIAAPALADAAQLMAVDSLMENTATLHDAPAVAQEIGPYKLQSLPFDAE